MTRKNKVSNPLFGLKFLGDTELYYECKLVVIPLFQS